MFDLYEKVKIKKEEITGHVVSIDDDGGTKPPIYLVEIDDKFKDGENDMNWFDKDELASVK